MFKRTMLVKHTRIVVRRVFLFCETFSLAQITTSRFLNVTDKDLKSCGSMCKAKKRCCSFEWSATHKMCNLHRSYPHCQDFQCQYTTSLPLDIVMDHQQEEKYTQAFSPAPGKVSAD